MSATSIAEFRSLIRLFLANTPAVSALVGTKIYSTHLRSADASTTLDSSPIIVFEMTAGTVRWHKAVSISAVDFYTYSKTGPDEAAQVYDAMFEALQHSRVSVDGVDPVALPRENQRPVEGFNQDVGAWFLRGRWTIEIS